MTRRDEIGELAAAFNSMTDKLVRLLEAEKDAAAARQAAGAGDAQGIRIAAHTLKGSSGNLGAQGMVQLCLALETLGASGSVREAEALIARLEAEFQRVQPTLQHASRCAG
jgi:HPt (histidine-containing phosphotransfer) domain-containing protein